jgi:hypothetical protein
MLGSKWQEVVTNTSQTGPNIGLHKNLRLGHLIPLDTVLKAAVCLHIPYLIARAKLCADINVTDSWYVPLH